MRQDVIIPAADGYSLAGSLWRHAPDVTRVRPLVIINPATSVVARYYRRFATYLSDNGFDVLTYDYRGIGGSAPRSLRGFEADWVDWGANDFEGVLRYAEAECVGQPVMVVAHSIGGFVIGLAESADTITRIFTMGAQFAHWRDYAMPERKRMFLRWHVAMPLLNGLWGYLPAKRLGWMEDTPQGVAADWAGMGPRFEQSVRKRRALPSGIADHDALADRFGRVSAPLLALGIEDDPFGTPAAINRLLGYFTGAERHHFRLTPQMIGEERIGHFAFFNKRYEKTLWPMAVTWLRDQAVPTLAPDGRFIVPSVNTG